MKSKSKAPLLNKEMVISYFGECRYSAELVSDSFYYHTIVLGDWYIFIDEGTQEDDEIIAIIYNKDKRIAGFSNHNLEGIINEIKDNIKEK